MRGWAQGLRGRGRKLQGYGISSTARRRRRETELRLHLPGVLEEAIKRSREKAPIMHQLVMVKYEGSAAEFQAVTTIRPTLNSPHLSPAPPLRVKAVP